MKLDKLRKKIDKIDDKIVELISERERLALEIGKLKKEQKTTILDRKREEEVLKRVKKVAKSKGIDEETVEEIFKQVISCCREVQGDIIVAFQGEPGAYSESAAMSYFGNSIKVKPCKELSDVFDAVENGEANFGIVPIENSLEGSVNRTYDFLLKYDLKVVGELNYRIVHCLISNNGVVLDEIKTVYSHPQALAQCSDFLRKLKCEIISSYDTAGSVKIIKEKKLKNAAAIAGARTAKIYGVKILLEGIEDKAYNYTRFFIISKQVAKPTDKDKTSVIFSVKHVPSSLFRTLEGFSDRKINLTKIESRPNRLKPWEYNFYLDFEGNLKDKKVKEAIKDLKKNSVFVKILGSYPKSS